MSTPRRELREFVAFLGFFYVLPIYLLYTGYLPFYSLHLILVVVGLILISYAINKGIPGQKLGFRHDTYPSALVYTGVVTAIGLVVVSVLWGLGILTSTFPDANPWFYVFYILLSAPLQEFIFRSLMFYELDLFMPGKTLFAIIFSALIYASAHLMYRDLRVLGITFFIGIIWGWIYSKRPNFWAVAISHMVLGAATVALGIV